MSRMPALYIPHGGGPVFFMTGEFAERFAPMRAHLASIAGKLPEPPKAILLVSAHWEADVVAFASAPSPNLIYDYSGFPAATYQIQYPAPGAPQLAADCVQRLADAGVAAIADATHGWDHGVFVPLKVMFPNADIPVVAMSLQRGLDPALHHAAGAALAPLREAGVLIVGSGMSYHNMAGLMRGGAQMTEESELFDAWLHTALKQPHAGRASALSSWRLAPGGLAAHPREEHLLPLMVASGAGSDVSAVNTWSELVGDVRVSAWSFA